MRKETRTNLDLKKTDAQMLASDRANLEACVNMNNPPAKGYADVYKVTGQPVSKG